MTNLCAGTTKVNLIHLTTMTALRSPLTSVRLKTFAVFVIIFGQVLLLLKMYDILFLLREHRAMISNQDDNCPDIPQISDFQQLLRENRIEELTKGSLSRC